MTDKPRILVIDQDPRGCIEIQQLLARSQNIVIGGVGYDEEALSLASELKPQVILVALEEPAFMPLQTLRDLTKLLPETPIVSYSNKLNDVHILQQAKAFGAREHLRKPFSRDDLAACIGRALNGVSEQDGSNGASAPGESGSAVFTIFGPKGGVGRTLVSINLAASMAKAGRSTVLVDLDPASGDVARRMKLRVDSNLVEASRRAADLDELTVESYLTRHASGVKVLPAPRDSTDWREIDPEAVDRLLALLAKVHEYVIVDTPASFTDLSIVAARRADVVLLLSSLDPSSIDSTSMALKMLHSANSDSVETRLALNHPSPRNSVKDSDAAQELGCDVFWSLPYDESIADRDEAGQPAVICRPKARISRSISKMASLLSEAGSPSSADRVRASGSTFLGRVLRTSS